MKINSIDDAMEAARLHGAESGEWEEDATHEVGYLRDMLRIVWDHVPELRRTTVLAGLQDYVDGTDPEKVRTVRVTLYDADDNVVESSEMVPEEAADTVRQFVFLQGSDPDESGRGATSGRIEFEPGRYVTRPNVAQPTGEKDAQD